MNIKTRFGWTKTFRSWLILASLALGGSCPVLAALTDLAPEPLPTLVTTKTKPNILFVLDNSGSMGWDYMPDDVKNAASDYTNTYGYKSAQCNGVAYDPGYTYTPPLNADGTSFPPAVLTAAKPNGFGPTLAGGLAYYSNSNVTTGVGSKSFVFSGGFFAGLNNWLKGIPSWKVGDTITAVDVSDENHWVIGTITSFSSVGDPLCLLYCNANATITVTSYNGTDAATDWQVNKVQIDNLVNSTYYVYNGTQARMNWTYSTAGVLDTPFKQECISHPGNPPGEAGDGKFTGVVVTAGSAEAQNYANWYQYYRTRMLMMRSAAGRAFQPLSNSYRVGFMTINGADITERTALRDISAGNAFLNVRDYDTAQRTLFLERLYNTTPNGSTPLRNALARAGQYYGAKASGQTYDPVQYACQRNYSFLSTDGYWNDTSNPTQINRSTAIGQQDGADVRPFNDGGSSTSRLQTTVTERKETDTPVTVSQNYTRTDYTYAGTWTKPDKACSILYPIKKTATTYTTSTTASGNQVKLEDWVTTTTVDTVTTAGVQTTTTSTAGPVLGATSSTSPIPTAPTLASVWTAATPTSSCQSSTASTPATTGVSPIGNATTTATGPAVTATISTTTAGPTMTVIGTSGGVSNTLADVAEYYYNTDLRTPALSNCTAGAGGSGDVCDNTQVKAVGRDTATWQHMSTFTLGLGVNGTLAYDRNYLARASDPTSAYYKIIKGGSSGLEWPTPSADNATTIDDLWHAAVNGRGQYFGAKNATDLTDGLNSALSSMGKDPGAGAAVGPTSIDTTSTNYLTFGGKYTTVQWTGDVEVHAGSAVDPLPSTGQAGVESLARRNASQTDRRTIYYGKAGSATLKDFTYANLSADGLGGSFAGFCNKSVSDTSTVAPLQCSTLNAAQITMANDGTNLVNWLRGSFDYEESNPSNPLYRKRVAVLGDIVNSQPVVNGPPELAYADAGYAAFKAAKANRTPVVYVGANDGMLHAFSAKNDANLAKELWAFVPTTVMPNMFRPANTDYANHHQYLVDGTPVIGDIYAGGAWRSILVAGLNSGGKGLYALDVTDPASPKLLWEFTDTQLGYTYGRPIITKLPSGTWVVAFASGYNNTSGKGYLYVVNAYTGASLVRVTTKVGSTVSPSGLAHLNAWVDSVQDNTAKRIYGGDLLGNVWRFVIAESSSGVLTGDLQRLAVLQVNSSTPEPITTRPELAEISAGGTKYPVLLVGTGRYLGVSDITDTTRQAIYAIKDPLTASDWGDVRANTKLINNALTISNGVVKMTGTPSPVNWASDIGWRIDLITSKERVVINMQLQYTTLVAAAGIPGAGGACSAAKGQGRLYAIDVESGLALPGADGIGFSLGDGMPMGIVWGAGPGGSGVWVTNDDGSVSWVKVPTKSSPSTPKLRRASWRELFND
ncbi:MAG: hypothetical protein KGL90_14850 [Burkholderiales bacterium]|nr:hypothetical protein [Burkholderiales bacterium]